jgi:16S rRNA (cytosine967-C5)-methyltransferase
MLHKVFQGRSLSDLLSTQLESVPPDLRPLIQELCFGALRWHPRLDALAAQLLERPLKSKDGDVHALILLGFYQLLSMRVAPHAAVTETVEAARQLGKPWAAGLVNGVLRRFQREQELLLERVEQEPVSRYACPAWLLEALREAWPDHWQAILEAANQRPPMSLRVNLLQGGRDQYLACLAAEDIAAHPLPEPASAVVLEQPRDVLSLPGFVDGRVSVQDGGAQLAAGLLDLRPGQGVLDACAAPGGKSCHILEMEPNIASLTAVDVDGQRLQRVEQNLQRLGLKAELATGDAANPAGAWAARRYDRILLDVPCSATGVIRRHPDIKLLRRLEDIPVLVELQARILDAIWPLLAQGGMLLYATCSLLPQENERQVGEFLGRQGDARERLIDAAWGHPRPVGRQTLPGEQSMDGFYYACLEKV